MRCAILINEDMTYKTLEDFDADKAVLHDIIGCRFIDMVKTRADNGNFYLVVDDEGMFVDNAKKNPIASLLYGNYIYGKVLVVAVDYDTGRTLSLTDKQYEFVMTIINRMTITEIGEDDI